MHLWIAAGIIIILLALLGVQCQITSVSQRQHKLDCALVKHADGEVRRATAFEYYECIGR